MPSNGPNQPPDGNGFSGFKGSIFNLAPTGGQSPAQQSVSSGGLFGAPATTAPAAGATPATGAGGLFGTSASSPAPSPAPMNLFGQGSPEKPSPFGQSLGGDDSMQTSPDAKSAITSKPSIFTNGSPAPPPAFGGGNLFSTTNPATGQSPSKPLFGEKSSEQSTPGTPAIFGGSLQPTPPTTTPAAATPNLFGGASPAKPAADAPAQNPFQTGNLFGGAPAASSTDPAASKSPFQFTPATSGPSLFSKSESTAAPAASAGLFGAKPALGATQPPSTGSLFAPNTSAANENPAKAPEGNPFGGLFEPKPAGKPEEQKEQAPPAQSPFSGLFAPKTADKPSESPKPAGFAPSFSGSTPSGGADKPVGLFQPPAGSQPAASTTAAAPANGPHPGTSDPSQRIENLIPKYLPPNLSEHLKEDVILLHRVRVLNHSFQRQIMKLDPMNDDFDLSILYYMRIRETIGAPTGGPRVAKRKARDEEAKREAEREAEREKNAPSPKKVKPSEETSSAPNNTKLFGASEPPKSSTKRRADDDEDDAAPAAKRTHGVSATANIFAKTFSKKSSESENGTSFKPATPELKKTAPESTTPTTSPAKNLFGAPSASQESSTKPSLFGQPIPSPEPGLTPTASAAAPAKPFFPKVAENKSGDAAAAPSFGIPKFGGGSTTDFFSQFKSKADTQAEKEKKKRKEEDYDSEEEDEAEWERKDAEKQRQKQEEYVAQTQKRTKFVPGKGFVFEDGSSSTDESAKKAEQTPATDASVFDKPKSPSKPSNIFGHLSATPSEVEDNDGDDTDEASAAGDEPEPKDPTTSVESSANDSEDGDFGKALAKSKQAPKPEKSMSAESTSGSDTVPATPSSIGRSMFDRADDSSKSSGGDSSASKPNPFGSLFSTPKPASPSGPGLFQPNASTSGSTNIFGSSTAGGASFGSTGGSTGSMFGSPIKPSNDHTWKKDSPIRFSTDSSKPDSGSGSESPKPFSTLFGAPPAGSNSNSSGSSQPNLGFSFGAPTQQTSSVFSAPSPATTSGTSATDTGASQPADGEAAEALPQVDLARSNAGEENEDCLMETRARGLKLKPKEGWDSQCVGFVRILKNRDTSRSRILLRAAPSGNVALNTMLMKEIKYTVNGTSVLFPVPQSDGSMEQWAIRVKKEEVDRLGSTMEDAKA